MSSCFLGPIASPPQLGCTLAVYHHATQSFGIIPRIEVMRDDVLVDITGVTYRVQETLPVSYPQFACDGEMESIDTRDETFDVFHISIEAGRAGEQLFVNGLPAGTIGEFTTTCAPSAAPTFSCGTSYRPCDDSDGSNDGGGCHTSGNSCGAALSILLVASLVITRARRHVRARTGA